MVSRAGLKAARVAQGRPAESARYGLAIGDCVHCRLCEFHSGDTAMTEQTSGQGFLVRYFKLTEHGTDVRTELLAGATTFVTMAYIIFVNPQMMAAAAMGQTSPAAG